MLAQRRRQWPNIEPAAAQCLLFAGTLSERLGFASEILLLAVTYVTLKT